MGKLMRRYWIPAVLSKQIAEPDCPPVRVRIMGEKLVAFRDSRGRVGILDEGLADDAYIKAHTEGYDAFSELVQEYDPESASKICGINADMIRKVARIYANAGAGMSIWTMGINQSTLSSSKTASAVSGK